ncbi:MAG: HD domain-containing protein [Defluviitaleaceae bacterium]|nr:HD domain-containing protein [Defluviitaleaceae bacterium]
MRYIKDIKEGERVIEHYLCKRKESRESRKGTTFLSLKLQDKTGQIDAKIWEVTADIGPFEEGDVVKIDGQVTSYQNELQVNIKKLRRSRDGEYEAAEYIPVSKRDLREMYAQITELIESVKSPHIKTLLENIMVKNEGRAKAFQTHAAAMHMHHSYMGGLMEHTLSVAEICDTLCVRYKFVNRDILLAGALLHDIGKIYELAPLPQSEYTDDGQMLGHIIIGIEMVSEETGKIPGFPHELASLIKHLIVSHHGEFEFGSPKLPSTAEALLLHFADNIDAKLTTYGEILEVCTTPSLWTPYQKSLGRYVRKPGSL